MPCNTAPFHATTPHQTGHDIVAQSDGTSPGTCHAMPCHAMPRKITRQTWRDTMLEHEYYYYYYYYYHYYYY